MLGGGGGGGGGGGAVHLRPDTKSVGGGGGGGGGGGWGAVRRFRPNTKSGEGGLQPPTPHPRFDVIAFKCLMRMMRFIWLGAREKICPGPGLALGGPVCCDCSLLSESLEDPGMQPQGGSQYMV